MIKNYDPRVVIYNQITMIKLLKCRPLVLSALVTKCLFVLVAPINVRRLHVFRPNYAEPDNVDIINLDKRMLDSFLHCPVSPQ